MGGVSSLGLTVPSPGVDSILGDPGCKASFHEVIPRPAWKGTSKSGHSPPWRTFPRHALSSQVNQEIQMDIGMQVQMLESRIRRYWVSTRVT